jgi:endonuclease/exonuclease/phosphatase (EEP) superfamily protein YafD
LLATKLPLSDGGQLTVFNTHLERASQPDDTLQAQLNAVTKVLDKYESQGLPWVIGGDFNLLPLGQYRRLPAEQRTPYSADSELHLLWDKYPMIPTNNEASGIDRAQWLTHYPNDPGLNGPDRTVDYLFYSPKIKRVEALVRQDDTLRISDHLPVIARFLLPATP